MSAWLSEPIFVELTFVSADPSPEKACAVAVPLSVRSPLLLKTVVAPVIFPAIKTVGPADINKAAGLFALFTENEKPWLPVSFTARTEFDGVAAPEKLAELPLIDPAEKLPSASRATTVFGIRKEVALIAVGGILVKPVPLPKKMLAEIWLPPKLPVPSRATTEFAILTGVALMAVGGIFNSPLPLPKKLLAKIWLAESFRYRRGRPQSWSR